MKQLVREGRREGGWISIDHVVCTYLTLTIAHITRVYDRGERERERERKVGLFVTVVSESV